MPLRAPKGFIDETDPKVCQIGHPAPPWLVNYADLMTELVCFFVILYALSAALNKNVQAAKSQVDDMIKKGQMQGQTQIDKDGLKITIEEQGGASFFQSGSADTTPAIDEKIMKLAPILRKLAVDHDIMVEGHTDKQRISGSLSRYYDSNWELSTARATSVARLLIDKYGVPPERVGATGYGQYRPVCSEDTPECYAKNRRIVIFVKNLPPGAAVKAIVKAGAGSVAAAGGASTSPPSPAAAPAAGAAPPTRASP